MFNISLNIVSYHNTLVWLVYKPIKRVVLLWYNGWCFCCVETANWRSDVVVILIVLFFFFFLCFLYKLYKNAVLKKRKK